MVEIKLNGNLSFRCKRERNLLLHLCQNAPSIMQQHVSRFKLVTLNKLFRVSGFFFVVCCPFSANFAIDSHLNSRFRQINLQSSFLAHKNIRVSCFTEQRFEDVELRSWKSRSLPSLFPSMAYKRISKGEIEFKFIGISHKQAHIAESNWNVITIAPPSMFAEQINPFSMKRHSETNRLVYFND